MALLRSLAAAFLLIAYAGVSAAWSDGPYIGRAPDGSWLARWIDDGESAPRVKEVPVAVGQVVRVPAVGGVPAFDVRVRRESQLASDDVSVSRRAPLFVVADTHGEFEILVELLQKQRIVDKTLRWSFGRGHLVLLGDVFDRGPNHLEILWLIYQLEAEAAKAGGSVHFLLGNHEVMVLSGDLRYLNPKYVRSAELLGAKSYSQLVAADTVLGQWLRSKAAVMKLGELLCLHGGVSKGVVERELTLQQLNATVRDSLQGVALDEPAAERAGFVLGPLGPLWYRGYFASQTSVPVATSDEIDRIRAYYDVSAILVGHTTVPTVTPLYDGRVIAVQVYPHLDESSGRPVMEAVRIDKGRFLRARIDATLEPLAVEAAR